MLPGRIVSPSSGWRAGSEPAFSRIKGRELVWKAGTCNTTKIAAGKSAGIVLTTSRRLSTPPADAPITMHLFIVCLDTPGVPGQGPALRKAYAPLPLERQSGALSGAPQLIKKKR